MPESWTMRGVAGLTTDTLEPGDWLRTIEKLEYRWCKVEWAGPTAPGLAEHEPSMDVRVIYEGESKPTHYRIPSGHFNHWFTWAGKHRAVCEHCGGSWPCEPTRMQQEMTRQIQEDMYRCGQCGQNGGGMIGARQSTPDGDVIVQYHTAKSRKRCREALIKSGDEHALALLRASDAFGQRMREHRKGANT
jgi:hypothetical protein